MLIKNQNEQESNFWISYADLMAGLLFVFILLIGAIVSKSIILKSSLHDKESQLSSIESELDKKGAKLERLTLEVEQKNKIMNQKDTVVTKQEEELKFQKEEIDKLNKLLLESNTKNDRLNGKIVIVQNLLDTNKNKLTQNEQLLKNQEGKILILSNQLTQKENQLKLDKEQLLHLANALDEKENDYTKIVQNLQEQKAKIKGLTGIKIKVIAALKEQLGRQITIDPKNGSLKLNSSILFDVGSAKLKEEAKETLKKSFEEYIGALVTNPQIKPHLDRIIIEGHTDSDGSYLYNLDLSQQRAFAVMNYLLTLDFAKIHNIKPLMSASGRAFQDAVYIDGIEDKEASRRIEIKFSLKNDDAMQEIEKVLDAP